MDPRTAPPMLLAPGPSSRALSAPSRTPPPRQPAIDENVLAENCGYEIIDGQVFELAPAEEEHGSEHFLLPAVLGAFLAPEYKGAVDMLTRPSTGRNYAPDVSILARARDPQTHGRKVEELIFEVIDTESVAHVTDKVRKLIERGVRRAFLVDVNASSVSEWSHEVDGWVGLADDAVIVDRCFAVPVPVRALVDEVLRENAVAEALVARGIPAIARVEQRAEQRAEQRGEQRGVELGALRGRREALRVLLAARALPLSADHAARIEACDDAATLDAWIARGATAGSTDDVFAD